MAEKHKTALEELRRSQNECKQKENDLIKAENKVASLQSVIDDTQTHAQEITQSLSKAETDFSDAQPKIAAMIEADAIINNIAEQVKSKQASLNEATRDLNIAKNQADTDVEIVNQTEKKLHTYQTWLTEHQIDNTLSDDYPRIEIISETFKEAYKSVIPSQKRLDELKKDLQNAQNDNQAQNKLKQAQIEKSKAETTQQNIEIELKNLLNGKTREELEIEIEHLKEEKNKLDVVKSYEDARLTLHDGVPCPLCGAIHHPFAEGLPQSEDELTPKIEDLKTRIDTIKSLENDLRNAKDTQTNIIIQFHKCQNELENHLKNIEQKKNTIESQQTGHDDSMRYCEETKQKFLDIIHKYEPDYILNKNSGILERLKARKDTYERYTKKIQTLQQDIANVREQAGSSSAKYQAALQMLNNITIELRTIQDQENQKQEERTRLYGNENPNVLQKRLSDDIQKYKTEKKNADSAVSKAQNDFNNNQQSITRYKEDIQTNINDINKRQNDLLQECLNDHFESIEAMENSILDPNDMEHLQKKDDELTKKGDELNYRTNENNNKMKGLYANPQTDKSLEEVSNELKSLTDALTNTQIEYGSIETIIKTDDDNRINWKEAKDKENQFLPIFTRWKKLYQLIGSQQGDKYKVFVQNLTMKFLIHHANDYLQKLNSRYKLIPMDFVEDTKEAEPAKENDLVLTPDATAKKTKKRGRPKTSAPTDATTTNTSKTENYKKQLNFQLIDTQINDIRPTDNLSGGETFLISLSLALGLAAMASRNISIDTLYIDEGFGTLDTDTLTRTLQALCEFNGANRQIGIISHIEALKEVVTTKIFVSQNGQTGRSILSGAGVRRLSNR